MELKQQKRISQINTDYYEAALQTGLIFAPAGRNYQRGDCLFIVDAQTNNATVARITNTEHDPHDNLVLIRFIYSM